MPSSGFSYPVSPDQEHNQRGRKSKVYWSLRSPVSSSKDWTNMEASHRPKQTQLIFVVQKFKTESPDSIRPLPGSSKMGVLNRPRCLSSPRHPLSFKEIPSVHPQISYLPVHHFGSDTYWSLQGTSPDSWLIRVQSQEEVQMNTQIMVNLNQPLGYIVNQENSELKPLGFFFFWFVG